MSLHFMLLYSNSEGVQYCTSEGSYEGFDPVQHTSAAEALGARGHHPLLCGLVTS